MWQVSVGVGRIWDAAWISCIYQSAVAARCRSFTNHHFIVSYRSQWFLNSGPFIFGGWRRHTHTHSTAGHWCAGLHDKTGFACWCFQRSESQAWIKQFEGLFQAGKAGFVLQATTNKMRRPSLNQISSNLVKNWSKGLQSCDLGQQNTCVAIQNWIHINRQETIGHSLSDTIGLSGHVSNDLAFGVLTCQWCSSSNLIGTQILEGRILRFNRSNPPTDVDESTWWWFFWYKKTHFQWPSSGYQTTTGCWFSPSWKMMEFVNGKDDIPYMKWKIIHSCSSHHQPVIITHH